MIFNFTRVKLRFGITDFCRFDHLELTSITVFFLNNEDMESYVRGMFGDITICFLTGINMRHIVRSLLHHFKSIIAVKQYYAMKITTLA